MTGDRAESIRLDPGRSHRPVPGPVPALRLPELERFRLGTGLRVWVGEAHAVPEVSIRLLVEAGASAEAPVSAEAGGERDGSSGPAPPGVADLVGRLLTEGAGERDATRMAEWLDRLGASFGASVRYEGAVLSMDLLSEVLPEALDFLAVAVRAPRFEPQEVERVRSERLDALRRQLDEPAIVADHALIEAIYGSHLYGRPAGGTPETVRAVDRDAVQGFHARRFGARDGALVVFGDVRPAELCAALEARFGDWVEGPGRPDMPAPPSRAVAGGRVVLVDRPGSAQAEVRVGAVGLAYGAADLYAAQVANAVLGGLFNSRLNLNLREDKGWTYGARTGFRFRRERGPFSARTAVETRVTAPAIREILAELEGLVQRPPTHEEIRLAKNAMTLSLPLHFQTPGQVSRKVVQQIAYDLPADYWSRYRERVEVVTREEVVEVAGRLLRREDLALVVVTDAEAVRAELEAFGPVEVRPAP